MEARRITIVEISMCHNSGRTFVRTSPLRTSSVCQPWDWGVWGEREGSLFSDTHYIRQYQGLEEWVETIIGSRHAKLYKCGTRPSAAPTWIFRLNIAAQKKKVNHPLFYLWTCISCLVNNPQFSFAGYVSTGTFQFVQGTFVTRKWRIHFLYEYGDLSAVLNDTYRADLHTAIKSAGGGLKI